jgi:pilus assembly protein CpaF
MIFGRRQTTPVEVAIPLAVGTALSPLLELHQALATPSASNVDESIDIVDSRFAADFALYHARALAALEALSATDPLLRVSDYATQLSISEDGHARAAVERACIDAPTEVRLRLLAEFFGCGPIESLLDGDCTEIIINGRDAIWFESDGMLSRHDDIFHSALSYRNFISRMSREASIVASLDCPFADGRWRDMRVHLIIPPASGDEAVITLRRHPKNPWTLSRLASRGWATSEQLNALLALVHEKKNFVVIGGTGSGKTSVLNACLSEIVDGERAVIIEDTSELNKPNTVSTKLLARRDPQGHLREIDQSELLKQALRMRPDRIVMGEIRGGEAKDLLMAFATGHQGCMGTLHAENARQALIRLEMLIQIGAPQWNVHAVRSLIFLSLQAVVVVGKTKTGERKLEGIYRIASLEDVGFLIEKIA